MTQLAYQSSNYSPSFSPNSQPLKFLPSAKTPPNPLAMNKHAPIFKPGVFVIPNDPQPTFSIQFANKSPQSSEFAAHHHSLNPAPYLSQPIGNSLSVQPGANLLVRQQSREINRISPPSSFLAPNSHQSINLVSFQPFFPTHTSSPPPSSPSVSVPTIYHHPQPEVSPRFPEDRIDKCVDQIMALLETVKDCHCRISSKHNVNCPKCIQTIQSMKLYAVDKAPFPDESQCQQVIKSCLDHLLSIFHLRTSELTTGLIFFSRLMRSHGDHFGFSYFSNNVFVVLVVCIKIAHKILSESAFVTIHWSNAFTVHSQHICQMEKEILRMLDWNLWVDEDSEEYLQYQQIFGEISRF